MKELSDAVLRRYNRLFRQNDECYRLASRSLGYSAAMVWVLYTLLEEPGCTQSYLCDLLCQPKQSVNSSLKKLEQEGYVTLQVTESDKRSKHVFLTEKGTVLAKETAGRIRDAEIQALAENPEETEQFLLLQEHFNNRLAQALQPLINRKGEQHDH